MKQAYISPDIKAVELVTDDNIAQFVVSSHSVGENEGLAKENNFSSTTRLIMIIHQKINKHYF